MNGLIARAIKNTPAMNMLMLSIIAVGAFSLKSMRREVFPEFSMDRIAITVPYPGASPEEVEEGICQKLEEAVRSIDGIRKQVSVASEGSGAMSLELSKGANPQKVLADVRSEVDRITTFPVMAEDPEVKQITNREAAIQLAIVGPDVPGAEAEWALRDLAESVREELLRLPAVSQVELQGAKNYEIDIEISEEMLRRHGLTLQRVASLVRRENFDLPAGTIRTESQDVLVRGKNKRVTGEEIARLPLLTRPDGAVLTVGDLGVVRDEFEDQTTYTRVNGHPAVALSVNRTTSEDLLKMADVVNQYIAARKLPAGYNLVVWGDRSLEVRDRLELLMENGAQGLVLVLVLLGLFLNLRLALWVAAGIPISILGACALLQIGGQTMNMLSSFSFVMALGILVDDAIVVSENIFSHRQMGKPALQAAIDGTLEVAGSVFASVMTTIIAFLPLLFVSGIMGKFISVMPFAMIATLLLSLFESIFVLPCHLAHDSSEMTFRERVLRLTRSMPGLVRFTIGWPLAGVVLLAWEILYPVRLLVQWFVLLGKPATASLDWIADHFYSPILKGALANPSIVFSFCGASFLITAGLVTGGVVPFVIFPKTDSNTLQSNVILPDGTPPSVTESATLQIERAIRDVDATYRAQGEPVVKLVRRSVGNATTQQGPGTENAAVAHHLGSLVVELVDSAERTVTSDLITAEWRKAAGIIPGAESVTFGSQRGGPGGTPIEFKLLAPREKMEQLKQAVEETKAELDRRPGVFDIKDDSSPGKWEFQINVKDSARTMGVPVAEIAETVRAAYFGEEVMRLQRGRHEVKLMVRYPREGRRSLAGFDEIRIRAQDGVERPITELANVTIKRGYSEINRVDQKRSITISADVDEARGNALQVVTQLRQGFIPKLLEKYPGVSVMWEGQQEQTTESVQSLLTGLTLALVAMFVLLTLQFTSYFQPLLIMAIIPFGIMGAIWGHALVGMPITLFSLLGMVGLTGIVVNDSIVLIDFINERIRAGGNLNTSLMECGKRRLRPIFLTSVTTIAGMLPLLFEQSFQAQILIPMALSICFGLIASTVLCLILVPTFYQAQHTFLLRFQIPITASISGTPPDPPVVHE